VHSSSGAELGYVVSGGGAEVDGEANAGRTQEEFCVVT
jgi:hypothetical protein